MTSWTPEQLDAFRSTEEIHISAYRDDGTTLGTPTRIWSVVVDRDVYVRAYNGTASRWYRSALKQGAGRISAGGVGTDVVFTPVDGPELNDRIDQAYSEKYAGSAYLSPMISDRARAAAVRVDPKPRAS